jgi:DNA ligase-1
MKLFTQLYVELDQTNKTNEKVEAMRFYFRAGARKRTLRGRFIFCPAESRVRSFHRNSLREWAIEMSGIPEWLYLESRDTVGDGSETTALLLPNNSGMDETPLHILVEKELLPLRGSDEATQKPR